MNDHTTKQTTHQLCACGCGQPVPIAKFPSWQRKYITGHSPTTSRPLTERFWEKVDIGAPDECWEWQASTDKKGYGQIKFEGRKRKGAHQVAWLLTYGDYGDLHVLHKCDNPRCCNPHHLFLGTIQDNLADMYKKNRHPHGDTHAFAKFTHQQIDDIRSRYAEGGIMQKELAAQYGTTEKYISSIITRLRWKHV